ncbi:cupin domain-containing protein [Maridesulfovibrio sp.]|uniref:cupin domain-containing protein n=1 Tax=Maridesulfovibrio sp. TaxID=2795000 RepID=UPI002A18B526|nr:cupin domain-containing protein [Maridesulfovibrio sp.]
MSDTNLKKTGAPAGAVTPPAHILFSAIRLAGRVDSQIADCSVAWIAPGGGGPEPDHAHKHDHLFVVLSGCIKVRMDGNETTLNEHQSILVPGACVHSVWNASSYPAKVLGISLDGSEQE